MTTSPIQAPHSSEVAANLASFGRHLRAENKAPSTITTYSKAVVQLDAFLARTGMPQSVAGIRREHIEAFLVDLQEHGARRPRSRSGSAPCSST